MSIELPGVAVVTGAGGIGIGNAIAAAFVKAGCTRIAISDINPTTLAETADQLTKINPSVTVLQRAFDVSDPPSVESFFGEIKEKFGRVDYAVNNAGIIGKATVTSEMEVEEFDKVNSINYKGVWMCSKQELRIMKEQEYLTEGPRRQRGSIVNIASQLGHVGRQDAPAYCASKSAVIGLTRCDAIDHSPYGIRVNAVCPGVIETPLCIRPDASPEDPYGHLRPVIDMSPMKRMGKPEEIADIVVFLSSEKASFVQGAAWVADGGYIIA